MIFWYQKNDAQYKKIKLYYYYYYQMILCCMTSPALLQMWWESLLCLEGRGSQYFIYIEYHLTHILYQKMLYNSWYQKITFLISENLFLDIRKSFFFISENIYLDITKSNFWYQIILTTKRNLQTISSIL